MEGASLKYLEIGCNKSDKKVYNVYIGDKIKMKRSEILIMRLDAELKRRLQDAAELEHVSMSEIVRRLIDELPRLGVIKNGLVNWYDNNKE